MKKQLSIAILLPVVLFAGCSKEVRYERAKEKAKKAHTAAVEKCYKDVDSYGQMSCLRTADVKYSQQVQKLKSKYDMR